MNTPNKSRFTARCDEKVREFYREANAAVCRTPEEASDAFSAFQMKMLNGFVFHTNETLNRTNLLLAESVVNLVGSNAASVSEIQELSYKCFIESIQKDFNTECQYVDEFFDLLCDYVQRVFHYVGPCNLFRLEEGVSGLRSEHVSIIWADEFFETAKIAKGGQNWALRKYDKFDNNIDGETFHITVGGLCWSIKCACPKDIARQEARWMAEIFTSLVRLGIRPADYCHRAKYGAIEPNIFSKNIINDSGIIYNKDSVFSGGVHATPFYRADRRFFEEFHSEVFQKKIDMIFNSQKYSLGRRASDGLGWLSRGRQSSDMSERLLFFFTSLEALLSDSDQFSPVSDTIARFVSVILAKNLDSRQNIYEEMRRLYVLRSDLVHRGTRSAHLLNSNNVQHFAESCFSVIVNEVDLSMPHKSFLKDLKRASHGLKWPE